MNNRTVEVTFGAHRAEVDVTDPSDPALLHVWRNSQGQRVEVEPERLSDWTQTNPRDAARKKV